MPLALEKSVVRVLNQQEETIGTGFVIGENLLVTCAHVLAKAGETPPAFVTIQFYDGGEKRVAQLDEETWSPVDQADTAFLRLDALPIGVEPLPLASALQSGGHQYAAIGFPHQTGIADAAISRDEIDGVVSSTSGFTMLQLDGNEAAPGFSGAPVLDVALDRVVGMITWHRDEAHARIILAVTADTLQSQYPTLHLDDPAALLEAQKPAGEDWTRPLKKAPLWAKAGAGVFALVVVLLLLFSRIIFPASPPPSPTVTMTNTSAPTNTPAPTFTPTLPPTSTPLPEADVLIAEFDASHATRSLAIARRLTDDLQARLREKNLNDVSVAVIGVPLADEEAVRNVALRTGSKVVVWGWYDDVGIRVRIYLNGAGARAGREVSGTNEIPLAAGIDPNTQLSFAVSNVLPSNVSFISLFVIGHLYYEGNQYALGHQAFDAAMQNIPKTVALENESLLRFFEARQADAVDGDLVQVICGYAKAIELDPRFAEAYNNLGTVFARRISGLPFIGLTNLYPCLAALKAPADLLDYPVDFTTYLFDKASALNPDWILPKYNKYAYRWNTFNAQGFALKPLTGSEIKAGLKSAAEKQPDLSNAYILLGSIAVEEGDVKEAIRQYSAAAEAAAKIFDDPKLHFNLSQLFREDGQAGKAAAELEKAAALSPTDPEINLLLASQAYQAGQADAYNRAIRRVLPGSIAMEREESQIEAYDLGGAGSASGYNYPSTAIYAASVLKSRVMYESGDVDGALRELTTIQDRRLQRSPLESYLVNLINLAKRDKNKPPEFYLSIDPLTTSYVDRNTTSANAWSALLKKYGTCINATDEMIIPPVERLECENSVSGVIWGEKMATWDVKTVNQRIAEVYDLFQAEIGRRLYYQRGLNSAELTLGAACPYVDTFDAPGGRWQFETTILSALEGPGGEADQVRPLARFDGAIRIREVEPEVSYIDQVSIIIVDTSGQVHTLLPDLAVLQSADGERLVLHQGDAVQVNFPGFTAVAGPVRYWVSARGYYIPAPRSIDTVGAK